MKSINSIKTTITRLNNGCDYSHMSILSYLQKLGCSIPDFCYMIGLDTTLLNDIAYNELLFLLEKPDTRIFYSPGMTSLASDEVSIYSKALKTNIAYLEDKLKIIWDETAIDAKLCYYNSEFLGIKKSSGNLDTIHFTCKSVFDKDLADQKVLSQKFPLEHMNLQIRSTNEKTDGTIISEDSLEVTINHTMLNSDLQNIFRILYHFNFSLATSILKLYPASVKIISDRVTLNNFHNR